MLRPLGEQEIESVVRLIGSAMNSDEAEQARKTLDFHVSCKQHALDDGRVYYVLAEGDAIQGIVGLHQYVWGPAENVWLAWFAIDPNHRGMGLGKRLLDYIIDRATKLGYAKLYIETYSTPEFTAARAFYQAKGFAQTGAVESYLPNGGDMVVYCKELTTHV